MFNWWSSPETVTNINFYVGWAIVALALVAAIFQQRLSVLQRTKESPRIISADQRRAFLETLEDTPRGAVKVSVFSGNSETHAFALMIRDLLREAGYTTPDEPEGFLLFGAPAVGVAISCKNPSAPPPLVEPLRLAFRAMGISVKRQKEPDGADEDIVTIVVGLKE
jgi:hypothetical protein